MSSHPLRILGLVAAGFVLGALGGWIAGLLGSPRDVPPRAET
jgi:hypothetical protein